MNGFLLVPPGSTIHRRSREGWARATENDDCRDEDETWISMDNVGTGSAMEDMDWKRRDLLYNIVGAGLLAASGVSATYLYRSSVYTPPGFTRTSPTQFIAALGDPKASQGTNAMMWGIWSMDPGPRGVWLKDYSTAFASSTSSSSASSLVAPAGWTFDPTNWWLEEHGLIMESPIFPLPAGRYLVTGGRMVTTGLTIGTDGTWKLDDDDDDEDKSTSGSAGEGSGRRKKATVACLYDVTHLPCRSARYTPLTGMENDTPTATKTTTIMGSPLMANPRDFPVAPGADMPTVPGCTKQDYAVLFVVGKAT